MNPITPTKLEMSFFDALKEIKNGKMITRLSWNNNDYCLLVDGFLTIKTTTGFHTWKISDGDMEGIDWVLVTELN